MVQVDLASLFIPLLLRQRFLKHLGKEILPLKTVLRCSWIAPNLAGVKVILPPDSKALGVIGHIHRKLYQVSPLLFKGYWNTSAFDTIITSASAICLENRSVRPATEPKSMQNYLQDPFNKALAAGHAALDLTAEPQDQAALDLAEAACQLAQSNKVAYAFTGASNHGIDTFMTLKTAQPVDGHVLILLQSKQSASTGTTTLDYALEEMGKDLENSGIYVKGLEHVQGELHDIYAAQSPAFKNVLWTGHTEASCLL